MNCSSAPLLLDARLDGLVSAADKSLFEIYVSELSGILLENREVSFLTLNTKEFGALVVFPKHGNAVADVSSGYCSALTSQDISPPLPSRSLRRPEANMGNILRIAGRS